MARTGLLVTLITVWMLAQDSSASHHKKHHKKAHSDWDKKEAIQRDLKQQEEEEDDLFQIMEEDDLEEFAESDDIPPDPCDSLHCGAGRQCTVDSDDQPSCTCVEDCGHEVDTRRMVCTNHNTTFNSECEVYRARCHCQDRSSLCSHPRDEHLHVEYYGKCREVAECSSDELIDFPRRMREWLFNVMKELAERKELSSHYQQMEEEAEEDGVEDLSRRWSHAAVWKWCELNHHPHDNVVSRHELFPLKAPLHSLEHCMSPFLDSCDTDSDHNITREEWATCLQLDVDQLTAQCETLGQ